MKVTLKKIALLSIVTGAITVGTTNTAIAATNSSVNSASDAISDAISTGIGNISALLEKLFEKFGDNYQNTVSNTNTQNAMQASMATDRTVEGQAAAYTLNFTFNSLTAPSAKSKGPERISPGAFAALIPTSAESSDAMKNMLSLSSGALLAKTVYGTKDEAAAANAFVQVVGDGGDRVTALAPSVIDKAKSTPEGVSYLNTMATYNAATSVALNALFTLLAERMPLESLNNKDSALSYDQKGALRRMQPNWTTLVPELTTVDVLRESLYAQAEMRYEMYEIRMQLEQLNATMAALLLSQQQTMGKSLLMIKQQQVIKGAGGTTGG